MTYEEKKIRGLCVACGQARENLQVVKCNSCKEKERLQGIERRAARKASGNCRDCGEPKESLDRISCNSCLNIRNKGEVERQIRLVNEKKCIDCTAPLKENEIHKSCLDCRIKDRKKNLFIKIKVFDHYGSHCSCCKTDIFWHLTIDHLFNNGKEHREKVGAGNNIYHDLYKKQFPEGFATTCFNCNSARQHNGKICPHVKIVKEYTQKWVRDKTLVLNTYGQICYCCGEANSRFLSIDHINDDGAKERREMLDSKGRDFYKYLIKNEFPSGYQVSCFNCNNGRDLCGGICPHNLENVTLLDVKQALEEDTIVLFDRASFNVGKPIFPIT